MDSENHKLANQNKIMHGSIMKLCLENKACLARVADVMLNCVKQVVEVSVSGAAKGVTQEDLLDRLFASGSLSSEVLKQDVMSGAMPAEEDIMEEVVYRLHELKLKDVTEKQKEVNNAADLPFPPPRSQENFYPYKKNMEKFRSPASIQDWGEGEVKAMLSAGTHENRAPSVNEPGLRSLSLYSKKEDIAAVRDACYENYETKQKRRRKADERPATREKQLAEPRKEGDSRPKRTQKAKASEPSVKTSVKTRSKQSIMGVEIPENPAIASPKRKLEVSPATESPKRSKKGSSPKPKRKQTARKSTTPKKVTPQPTPMPTPKKAAPPAKMSPKKAAPPPKPNFEEVDPADLSLDESLVIISDEEEAARVGKNIDPLASVLSTPVVINLDDEPDVAESVDMAARDIKQELIEEADTTTAGKINEPESPSNED